MKKLLLTATLLINAAFCFCQNADTVVMKSADTIIMKDGSKIPCKVYIVGDVTVNFEIYDGNKKFRRKVLTDDVEKVIFFKDEQSQEKNFQIPNSIEFETVVNMGTDTLKYLLNENANLKFRQIQLNNNLKTITSNYDFAVNKLKTALGFSLASICLGVISGVLFMVDKDESLTFGIITGSLAVGCAIAVPFSVFSLGSKLRNKNKE